MEQVSGAEQPVAIVTGGGTGIGRAVSMALGQAGYGVVVAWSRSRDGAEDTVRDIAAAGGTAMAVRADVTDEAEVDAMVAEAVDRFGRLDVLVNNAGITRQLPFSHLAAIHTDDWDDLYRTNVKGAFFAARAAAGHLRRQDGAAIINVGSIAGETGHGSSIPYAVSKAAMHGLTKSLARALAPEIRVNGIMPGAVATRWWAGHEEKMHQLAGNLPLERISTPDDIAETVMMLVRSRSMTGQNIKAENGQTL